MQSKLAFVSVAALCALFADSACSTTFEPATCSSDADCGTGLACAARSGKNICVAAKDAPIVVGQSAPASGPSQDLGLEMKRGIQLAFDDANATGGVRGRPVTLDFLDDEYQPDLAEANARKLVDAVPGPLPPRCPTTTNPPAAGIQPFSETELLPGPDAVTAVLGSVGTPTMVRSAPVIVETGRLYFGAFTGATAMLRDDQAGPCKKYIFNVRASYAQEARATLEYFIALGLQDDKHLVSFDQNDTFGDAGYNGLVAAYTALKNTTPSITRFRYTRDDLTSVPAQATAMTTYLKTLLATPGNHVVGTLMTDTYGPGGDFVKAVRDWQYANDDEQQSLQKATRLHLVFSNVSFVGPNSLASRLTSFGTVAVPAGGTKPYTDDVYVSQVVPNYANDTSDLTLRYKQLITPTGAPATYTSFEGYIDGRIFLEGLRANAKDFTPDNLVTSFESLASLNIGLGGFVGFSSTSHQASNSIWGTGINPDGSFADKYFWSDGTAIQLVE